MGKLQVIREDEEGSSPDCLLLAVLLYTDFTRERRGKKLALAPTPLANDLRAPDESMNAGRELQTARSAQL
jgi:hypothetical protein